MGASITAKELKSRVQKSSLKEQLKLRKEQAQIAVETLGRMKGAAMKMGQLLSLDTSDVLPPELRKVFEALQKDSPLVMGFESINKILKSEFPEVFSEITRLSKKPIAAASIGQVHDADFRGQRIAIKVQYPGIAKTIDSDLAILKKMAHGALFLKGSSIKIDSVFSELSATLKQEVDYLQEKKNYLLYKKAIPPSEDWTYPQSIEALSSMQVISFEYIDAYSFTEWLKTNPPQEEKNKLAETLLEIYCREFFENRIVQTDPNPSNFLIRKKDLKLVLIDFGSVKLYQQSFVDQYKLLLQHVFYGRKEDSLEQIFAMNLLDSREGVDVQNALYALLRTSCAIFSPEKQPFDLNDKNYFEETKKSAFNLMNRVQYSPPPHELLFLHRKLGGLFLMLRDLNYKSDLTHYFERTTGKL